MKTLNNYINESKEKPLYSEWDIKSYFNYCLQKWTDNVRYFNIMNVESYSIVNMCKQCEIALMLFDKFADDIQLHFYSAESEKDKKKYGCEYSQENNVYKAFKVIEQISNMDLKDISSTTSSIDIKAEITELKSRFEELVKKCNDKWHKYMNNCSITSNTETCGCPVPCDCECCKCCC